MTPEEKVQALLRLKRHEKPPEGYFDDFLEQFHQRQREEILKQGSLALLWERMGTWAENLRRPAVGWSVAGAYAAVILLICVWPKQPRSGSGVTLIAQPAATAQGNPAIPPPAPREATLVALPQQQQPEGELKKVTSPADARKIIGPAEPEPAPAPPAGTAPKLREL